MAQDQKNESTRIWEGDSATIAEIRKRYSADPENGLLPLAVALYSFRSDAAYARELLALRKPLMLIAERLLYLTPTGALTPTESADRPMSCPRTSSG